jgi:hypothetical protein
MKFAIAALFMAGAAWGAACTDVVKCTEWVALKARPWRSKVYTSYPLGQPNPAITRAFLMIHGTGRDADNYFRSALAAGFLAGALEDTVIISPRIASASGSCQDKLDANEVSYSCVGDSWRSGGASASTGEITSFDFVDEILRELANKSTFPNLRSIVVAGPTAGGQFVNPDALSNQVNDQRGGPV